MPLPVPDIDNSRPVLQRLFIHDIVDIIIEYAKWSTMEKFVILCPHNGHLWSFQNGTQIEWMFHRESPITNVWDGFQMWFRRRLSVPWAYDVRTLSFSDWCSHVENGTCPFETHPNCGEHCIISLDQLKQFVDENWENSNYS